MKYHGKIRSFVLIIISILIVLQVWAVFVFLSDKHHLTSFFDHIASPDLLPSEQVKKIVGFLKEKPSDTNTSYFLLPVFSALRPTARQVIEYGGDCADRSRSVIRLLQLRNIQAAKWALYSDDLRPQHAVVEVETEKGRMVVDPLFGLWFPRPEGGYYDIDDLRGDPRILSQRIEELLARGEQPGGARLDFYPLNRYIYDHARSINWDKSVIMRAFYKILYWLMGEKVHDLPRPTWSEQPAIMAILGLAAVEIGLLVVWLISSCLMVMSQKWR